MWHWAEVLARQVGYIPPVYTVTTSLPATTPLPTATSNPLPTFTPPTSCYGSTYTIGPGGNDTYAAGSYVARGVHRECYPAVASPYPYLVTTSNFNYTQYPTFSPGICPGGHTIAGGVVTQGVIAGNNTVATCCPRDFTLTGMSCMSQASNLVVSGSQTMGGATITLVDGGATTTTSAVYLRAVAIPIAWNSLDLSYLSSTSEMPSTSAGSAPTLATNAAATPSPVMPDSSISTGAKAGIGVGAALAVILLVVLGLIFWRRRRSSKPTTTDVQDTTFEKAELPGEGVHRELDGEGVKYESGGFSKPHEVGDNVRAELEGDWTGWEAPVTSIFRPYRVPGGDQSQPERHPSS